MVEVMAIIRMNMINQTKEALLRGGFSSLTCRKVMGRGKQKVDYSLIEGYISNGNMPDTVAEAISEGHRLVPKRLITMIIDDKDVEKVVSIIIDTNKKGKQGDGKIFVIPVKEVMRIRNGDVGKEAI